MLALPDEEEVVLAWPAEQMGLKFLLVGLVFLLVHPVVPLRHDLVCGSRGRLVLRLLLVAETRLFLDVAGNAAVVCIVTGALRWLSWLPVEGEDAEPFPLVVDRLGGLNGVEHHCLDLCAVASSLGRAAEVLHLQESLSVLRRLGHLHIQRELGRLGLGLLGEVGATLGWVVVEIVGER